MKVQYRMKKKVQKDNLIEAVRDAFYRRESLKDLFNSAMLSNTAVKLIIDKKVVADVEWNKCMLELEKEMLQDIAQTFKYDYECDFVNNYFIVSTTKDNVKALEALGYEEV